MKCKKCNNDFTEKYSKWSNGEFCSKECATKYSRNQIKKLTKKVNCITCQKEIEVDIRASSKLCKCDDCRKRYKNKRSKNGTIILNKCLSCSKDTKHKKYCSSECQQKFHYINYINQWKQNIVDGTKSAGNAISNYVRRYLWIKYDNKCSRCGWDKPNPITKRPVLEIEHIDGNSNNNKEENLDLICPNCHSLTSTYKALNKGNGNRKRLKYHKMI
jgi:hypothetical protein